MSTTKWALDPSHSEVNFKIKHMMISNVSGSFKTFNATGETQGDDFTTAKVNFTADINSITTNNEQRDGHLKSGDFFDAEKYPQLKFETTKIEKDGDGHTIHGNLTIRDITKPVKLKAEFGGIAKDPYGNTKAGFTIEGKINRKDFGLTWSAVTEAGGVVVSDDVKLHAEVQFVKQA